MHYEGPPLQLLVHRLAECPDEFLAEPRASAQGEIFTPAIVADLLRAWEADIPQHVGQTFAYKPSNSDANEQRSWLQIVSIACWLLHDEWFLKHKSPGEYSQLLWILLSSKLDELSRVVDAKLFVSDAHRREELARFCLSVLGLRPQGETQPQAQDRLKTLDSVERQRVVLETRAAQKRAQEIREEMQRKAAEEAASRYTRE
jgi:hypothetical protein